MKKTLLSLVLLAFPFSLLTLSAQTMNTAAGTGATGYNGDGIQATIATIGDPTSVATDASGNFYIADFSNSRIRMVNTSGIITTIAGNGTGGYSGDGSQATAAEILQPVGIRLDATGNMYIADYGNQRIRKVNTNGIISTIAGNGTAGFSGDGGQATAAEINLPFEASVDGTGNVYIADHSNNRIRMVNTNGVISTFAGNGTGGYGGDGGQATAAELSLPEDMIMDGSGNLYIADYGNSRVREVNSSGIISTFAGTGAFGFSGDGGQATAAEIYNPTGVTLNGGNVYIADYRNNRIRMVDGAGIITTIAGNGATGFSGDGGPATAAEMDLPFEIAISGTSMYIADQLNNRVRVVMGLPLGVNTIPSDNLSVMLYPNPNNGQFMLQMNSEKLKVNSSVDIYNMMGEEIYSAKLSSANCHVSIDKPSGIYLYKIVSEKGDMLSEGKFIVEK